MIDPFQDEKVEYTKEVVKQPGSHRLFVLEKYIETTTVAILL